MTKIAMNRDDMTSGTAGILKCAASLETLSKGIEGKFSSAIDAGFLAGPLNSITSKTSSISGSLGVLSNTINRNASEMYEMDQKGAEMFNAMEISKDFYANNDAKTKTYTAALLQKMDSKSVNEGELKDSRTGNEETIIKEEILKDIRGQEGKVYDEQHSGVENVALGNINVAEDTGVEVRTDSSVINQALGNINNGVSGTQRRGEDAEVVNANIKNVNKGPVGDFNGKEGEYKVADIKKEPEIVEVGNDRTKTAPTPPLATSAYDGKVEGTKSNSIGAGLTAGLAGLAGLAGVAGMTMASRENEKEEDEEEKDKKEDK